MAPDRVRLESESIPPWLESREGLKPGEKEQLYEAYNQLHSLAQDFQKPFDAPAVLVVGHQTGGKSALIEALMGFQFNQVGGGTKTRRPVALRMQYNPDAAEPQCFLTTDNGVEEPQTLAEIQQYIESENKRLEQDPGRCFDPREIMVRVEYKYSPNMIIIDTPGLLSAPKAGEVAGGGGGGGVGVSSEKSKLAKMQRQALERAAREAENLVLAKMSCPDYVILCVEDTNDWKHATTRNVVMKADPDLTRTVVVSTKLDTKLPQFAHGDDLEEYLRAPLVQRLYPSMLGGPFFTSVPCGRVGSSTQHDFGDNAAFRQAMHNVERGDVSAVLSKLGSSAAVLCRDRVGVRRLRSFLERRVEDCYRRNVARIVPLLQGELRGAKTRLSATTRELSALSPDSLKNNANMFREHFIRALNSALQGTIEAPPGVFGETVCEEQLRGGTFVDAEGPGSDQLARRVESGVGNAQHRLFGGAQYHRALREFALSVKHMPGPEVTEDEVANAAGVGDMHDGVNFMRAACVIAVEKAKSSFDPLLEALRHRTVHIMKRLYPIVEYMLRRDGQGLAGPQHKRFHSVVRRVFDTFTEQAVENCLKRCHDDLQAITRYVTWDLQGRAMASGGGGALGVERRRNSLGETLVHLYPVSVMQPQAVPRRPEGAAAARGETEVASRVWNQWEKAGGLSDDASPGTQNAVSKTLAFIEEALTCRETQRSGVLVSALVQHIMESWREHFARTVIMKWNCFFMMPFMDDFPFYLRRELDKVYSDKEMADMFDVSKAKQELVQRHDDLLLECRANERLQTKFDHINSQLHAPEGSATAATSDMPENGSRSWLKR